MFQIHPIHVPSRAIVVRVNQFVREHVFHLRPRLNLVIAQAYPFSRHESTDDLLVTLLDVEESLIDGAPGLLELFEQEPNRRVTKGDIFQLGRAFFRRHLYTYTHTRARDVVPMQNTKNTNWKSSLCLSLSRRDNNNNNNNNEKKYIYIEEFDVLLSSSFLLLLLVAFFSKASFVLERETT
jgi:hypothetical protein